jgi:hypothetical protein
VRASFAAVLVASIAAALVASIAAAEEPSPAPTLSELAEQVRQLTRRVRELEARPSPPPLQAPPQKPQEPLDVREPPFGEFDFSWLNGNNRQPASLLQTGILTWSIYVDGYFSWDFQAPVDHTIFPTTTGPRHNEISLNLGAIGVDLALDGPIGRLYVQYGSNVATVPGQDSTFNRGFYLTAAVFQYVQQAAAGWHFHFLHGVNLEIGIFPSYVGLESYLAQENWNYSHALLSDSTPYYFSGIRNQWYLTQRLKLELWLVNGWQTFGQWNEARAGGYLLNWRPREWLSLTTCGYFGQDAMGDPDSLRSYFDNYAQVQYHKGSRIHSAAFAVVLDAGYERRTTPSWFPSGAMAGASFAHRVEWTTKWATTIRGDLFYDATQSLIPHLPVGSPYLLPTQPQNGMPGKPFLGGGVTVTQDFLPSPWLLMRLEYVHREANVPYFSGPGGITGPGGVPAADPATFTPDLRNRDDRITVGATLRL